MIVCYEGVKAQRIEHYLSNTSNFHQKCLFPFRNPQDHQRRDRLQS